MDMDSEDAFLRLIDACFANRAPGLCLARGDDAAVLDLPGQTAISTDLFLEDVHFRRAYFTPYETGRKALAVNLSDLAAMGARPITFTLCLGIPAGLPERYWLRFFSGMAELAFEHELVLAGGDLSRAGKLAVSITILGAPGPSGRFLARGRGGVGDDLYVLGPLGLAKAGLTVLEERGRAAFKDYPKACRAHLSPAPLVAAGLILADIPGVRGAMDVSDGLAMDLPRFLPPGLGARLEPEAVPVHPETVRLAGELGLDPQAFALSGGEDYALLFAAAPPSASAVRAALPEAVRIGRITAGPGILTGDRPLTGGFDHFRAR